MHCVSHPRLPISFLEFDYNILILWWIREHGIFKLGAIRFKYSDFWPETPWGAENFPSNGDIELSHTKIQSSVDEGVKFQVHDMCRGLQNPTSTPPPTVSDEVVSKSASGASPLHHHNGKPAVDIETTEEGSRRIQMDEEAILAS